MKQERAVSQSFWIQQRELWHHAKDKFKRVLLWVLVSVFLLFDFGVISPDYILKEGFARQVALAFLMILVASIIDLHFDTRKSVEKILVSVKRLEESSHIGTLDLGECIKDMSSELSTADTNNKIIIKQLGINLVQAWERLKQDILSRSDLKDVELRVLMLTSNPTEIEMNPKHPVPRDVIAWCGSTGLKLNSVKSYMNDSDVVSRLAKEGRKLTIEIRQYSVLPTVHGFSVSGPVDIHYVSFCRWQPNKDVKPECWDYVWGERSYHKISIDTPHSSVADLGRIFDGHFEYLWETSNEHVYIFPETSKE